MTAFAWSVAWRAWTSPVVVPWPGCEVVLGFSIFLLCAFLKYAFRFALFLLFLCTFHLFLEFVLQNMFCQIQVEISQ
jgi:hypothetical protein